MKQQQKQETLREDLEKQAVKTMAQISLSLLTCAPDGDDVRQLVCAPGGWVAVLVKGRCHDACDGLGAVPVRSLCDVSIKVEVDLPAGTGAAAEAEGLGWGDARVQQGGGDARGDLCGGICCQALAGEQESLVDGVDCLCGGGSSKGLGQDRPVPRSVESR
jgi:hypothetical protein